MMFVDVFQTVYSEMHTQTLLQIAILQFDLKTILTGIKKMWNQSELYLLYKIWYL